MAFGERQKCGAAEIGRPERSERETLPDVPATVLLAFLFVLEDTFALKRLGISRLAAFSDRYCDITIIIAARHAQFFEMLPPECDARLFECFLQLDSASIPHAVNLKS